MQIVLLQPLQGALFQTRGVEALPCLQQVGMLLDQVGEAAQRSASFQRVPQQQVQRMALQAEDEGLAQLQPLAGERARELAELEPARLGERRELGVDALDFTADATPVSAGVAAAIAEVGEAEACAVLLDNPDATIAAIKRAVPACTVEVLGCRAPTGVSGRRAARAMAAERAPPPLPYRARNRRGLRRDRTPTTNGRRCGKERADASWG